MTFPTSQAFLRVPLALVATLASFTSCGQEPPTAPAPSTPPVSASSPARPLASGGLEVVVQPDEDPNRPGYFDFGEAPLGSFLNHTFIMRNSDPQPVTLQGVEPGCGCTVARIGKRLSNGELEAGLTERPDEMMILAPGEVLEIALRVDTTAIAKKNIDKLFMVRITTDSEVRPYVTLECHLVVQQHFQLSPANLNFGAIPMNGEIQGVITIRALGQNFHKLDQLGPLPEGVRATLAMSASSSAAIPVWELTAQFLPPLEKRPYAATLPILTLGPDGEPGQPLAITMAATAVDDVGIRPPRLILRPSSGHEDAAVVVNAELVSHLPGHSFKVTGYSIHGSQAQNLNFTATPFQPLSKGESGRWNLSLSTHAQPSEAAFTGTVSIELDDPQYPQIELPFVGHGF